MSGNVMYQFLRFAVLVACGLNLKANASEDFADLGKLNLNDPHKLNEVLHSIEQGPGEFTLAGVKFQTEHVDDKMRKELMKDEITELGFTAEENEEFKRILQQESAATNKTERVIPINLIPGPGITTNNTLTFQTPEISLLDTSPIQYTDNNYTLDKKWPSWKIGDFEMLDFVYNLVQTPNDPAFSPIGRCQLHLLEPNVLEVSIYSPADYLMDTINLTSTGNTGFNLTTNIKPEYFTMARLINPASHITTPPTSAAPGATSAPVPRTSTPVPHTSSTSVPHSAYTSVPNAAPTPRGVADDSALNGIVGGASAALSVFLAKKIYERRTQSVRDAARRRGADTTDIEMQIATPPSPRRPGQ